MSGTQSSVKEVPFSSVGVLTSRRKNVTCSFGNCEASLSTVLLEHGLGQGFLHKSRAVIEETVWACADLKCQEEERISPMSGWGSCVAESHVTDTPRVAPMFTVPPFYFQCHSPQSTTQPGQRMPETQCDAWQTQRGLKCHSRSVPGGDLVLSCLGPQTCLRVSMPLFFQNPKKCSIQGRDLKGKSQSDLENREEISKMAATRMPESACSEPSHFQFYTYKAKCFVFK